jgi:putative membrane protein
MFRPLDNFCRQVAADIDILCSRKKDNIADLTANPKNKILFPLSKLGCPAWAEKGEDAIREELRYKTAHTFYAQREEQDKDPQVNNETV